MSGVGKLDVETPVARSQTGAFEGTGEDDGAPKPCVFGRSVDWTARSYFKIRALLLSEMNHYWSPNVRPAIISFDQVFIHSMARDMNGPSTTPPSLSSGARMRLKVSR